MPATNYDVLAIGNAIVDVVRRCDDAFLRSAPGSKGQVTLVPSSDDIRKILGKLKPGIEVAGGGATNTAVGVAYLGGTSAFVGRVAEDEYGRIFRHDIVSAGVAFPSLATAVAGKETAHALVLVTPDGRRTIFTFLGCSSEIDRTLIEPDYLSRAKIVFAEGYLMDRPDAKAALLRALSVANASGKRFSMSLSDAQCVERHRTDFQHLVRSGIGVLFANEAEIKALYDTPSLDEAMHRLAKDAKIAVVTRSAKGASILSEGSVLHVPAERVEKVVDATGAGELYAAGFLYNLARGKPLEACGRLGAFAAAEILRVMGARPEQKLGHLARMRGLL